MYKLTRSIYTVMQLPRKSIYYVMILTLEFMKINDDYCVYLKWSIEEFLILAFDVDKNSASYDEEIKGGWKRFLGYVWYSCAHKKSEFAFCVDHF